MNNIFSSIPANIESELFEEIVKGRDVRIERIISKGHTSPETGWYDQDENEWVIVLQGAAELEFSDDRTVRMKAGDYINIPANQKHKVSWTAPDQVTVWLAVFYK